MNILNMAFKDLKMMARNRLSLLLLLILPLFMIFLMGTALKDVFNQDKEIIKFQVLYVNEDNGNIGKAFDDFIKNKADKFIEVVETKSADIEYKVLREKYDVAVVVPAGLSDNMSKSEKSNIRIISSGKDPVKNLIAASIVDCFGRFAGIQLGILKEYSKYNLSQNIAESSQRIGEVQAQFSKDFIVSKDIGVSSTKKLSSFQYFTLSMLLFFMFSAGIGVGNSIVDERTNKVYGRISSYPVKDSEYLMSKILSNLVLSILQVIVIIVFTTIVFNVKWGSNFLGIGITITLIILISSSIGLIFSSLINSANALNSAMIIIMWLITFISGGFSPVPALEPIGKFTFYKWGLNSLSNFMVGGSIMDVSSNLMLLLITALMLWTTGLYLYKRRISYE